MKAIDEIVHTVKPQKLIFLAVDGVAPQQKWINKEQEDLEVLKIHQC
jgi:5'-3' exonuclease